MRRFERVGIFSKCCIFALVIFIFSVSGSNAFALQQSNWTGNLNAFLGMKNLDEDDWDPLEKQLEYGLDVDFKQNSWPVSAALGYWRSWDDDTVSGIDVEGNTSELYAGVRKIFEVSKNVQPFIGGGLAYVTAELEASLLGIKISDDDTATGYWVEVGVYFPVTEHFNIGIDLRYSKAEVALFGTDGEAGGLHYGILAGYHW